MAEMKWIKLRIDMFDDEKIKMIQALPDGDAILVIWIRLIALAGKCNANGLVLVEDEFPYSDEMLSVIFNKPLNTVRLALSTFERYRMTEQTTKGIYITNFEKHQNVEGMERIKEQNRERKRRERERRKALLLGESHSVPELPPPDDTEESDNNVMCHVTVTGQSREVTTQRENKNIDIDRDINNISSYEDIVGGVPTEAPESKGRLSYDVILNDYNNTCQGLPKIKAISDKRKTHIRSLLKSLDKLKILSGLTPYEKLHCIFQSAHESDFLSGRNGKWDGCSFDWLINTTNALKVLEGNYNNERGVSDGGSNARDHSANVPGTDETTSEALRKFRERNGSPGL